MTETTSTPATAPTAAEVALIIERTADRAARWLAAENGTGELQQVVQVLARPMQHLGKILRALQTAAPDRQTALVACADLVITAYTAKAMLGSDGIGNGVDKAMCHRKPRDRARFMFECDRLAGAVTDLAGLVVGWLGHDPRKRAGGSTTPTSQVGLGLDVVAEMAGVLIAELGYDVGPALVAACDRVNDELDELGLPR
ncbi:hypothetical protein I0C86_40565 [Plantactinospora sp. S1510]|uniref:Uncharacterized protein n=1 Tax=Plantactinospora alkalitolerans TaxID=2789879 RepID=A0ABS0H9M5_9ACTN|nr:hypothetical protein [Plantactinospora alkalitolerans]MBF9135175.1 hypothetical protein [Plantactinospora alkalitolerans]